MSPRPPAPKDPKDSKDEYERKMERWFRHLPADHPLVKILFRAAVDRARGIQEVLPAGGGRR